MKIYLLYDDVGCFWLPRAYKDRLRAAGIKMHGFNHRHRFLRFLGPTRIQYRNHRKIVIVDGEEAWIGGLNVGDEYMGRSKVFGHWRDTHVRFKGPAVLAAEPSADVRSIEWRAAASLHNPGERESLRFDYKDGMLRNILTPQVPRRVRGTA